MKGARLAALCLGTGFGGGGGGALLPPHPLSHPVPSQLLIPSLLPTFFPLLPNLALFPSEGVFAPSIPYLCFNRGGRKICFPSFTRNFVRKK